MSPFARVLKELRYDKGLPQQDLAEQMGCERSYLSSLENDLKKAPPADFVESVCRVMQLSDEEAKRLREARERSRRAYTVPSDAPEQAYKVAFEYFTRLERLSSWQLEGLMSILRLGDIPSAASPATEGRVRRKDRRRTPPGKENAM